jgi:predicted nucleotide-binding protein
MRPRQPTPDELASKLRQLERTTARLQLASRAAQRPSKVAPITPKEYFVAHEFSRQKRDDLRRAIDEALADSGLTPYYADIEVRQGHIFKDKILLKIRETQFGIYDVSNPRKPNVFMELGAAIAMDKTCFIICWKGTRLPSDVLGLDHIEYDSHLDLTDQLRAKVAKALRGA